MIDGQEVCTVLDPVYGTLSVGCVRYSAVLGMTVININNVDKTRVPT